MAQKACSKWSLFVCLAPGENSIRHHLMISQRQEILNNMRGWPRSWAGWQSALAGTCRVFDDVAALQLKLLAGNAAVVTVPTGMAERSAAVLHLSQRAYTPKARVVNRDDTARTGGGTLTITSPSWQFDVMQSARINTLVLVPPTLADVQLSLVAGELWYFGPSRYRCPSSEPTSFEGSSDRLHLPAINKVSASLTAGDVNIIDAYATQITGRNVLGDVNIRWDLVQPQAQAGYEAPWPPPVAVSGSTWLGDVRLAACAPDLDLVTKGALGWVKAAGLKLKRVACVALPGAAGSGHNHTDGSHSKSSGSGWQFTGAAARNKWQRTTGREFFE
jgi:hypothetical protein